MLILCLIQHEIEILSFLHVCSRNLVNGNRFSIKDFGNDGVYCTVKNADDILIIIAVFAEKFVKTM